MIRCSVRCYPTVVSLSPTGHSHSHHIWGSHRFRSVAELHGFGLKGVVAGALVWWVEAGVFGKLFKRVADAKAGEAMVVAIGGHPLAAAFNGQRSEKGIRNEVAFDIGRFAQTAKDLPMAGTRIDDGASRLIAKLSCERHGLIHAARRIEHTWMGDDSEKAAQHQIGQTVGVVGVEQVFKPSAIEMMVR
jgi:hypothetical protein